MPAGRGIQSGGPGAGGGGIGDAAGRIGSRRNDERLCSDARASTGMCREFNLLKSQEEYGPERKAGSTACFDSPPRIRPKISGSHCQRAWRDKSCQMHNRMEWAESPFPKWTTCCIPARTLAEQTLRGSTACEKFVHRVGGWQIHLRHDVAQQRRRRRLSPCRCFNTRYLGTFHAAA